MDDLKVNIIKYPTNEDWLLVKNNALITMGKHTEKEPDYTWKIKLLKSEHSPIRNLEFVWEWINLPSWISVHFVRHKIGIEHFVKSQRNDRQGEYDRTKAPQDAPVIHRCWANAQSIINISQKRLCHKSANETRHAWGRLLYELSIYSPELFYFCVPTCVYRNGICPEFESCGYNKTTAYKIEQEKYLNLLQGENMK